MQNRFLFDKYAHFFLFKPLKREQQRAGTVGDCVFKINSAAGRLVTLA